MEVLRKVSEAELQAMRESQGDEAVNVVAVTQLQPGDKIDNSLWANDQMASWLTVMVVASNAALPGTVQVLFERQDSFSDQQVSPWESKSIYPITTQFVRVEARS